MKNKVKITMGEMMENIVLDVNVEIVDRTRDKLRRWLGVCLLKIAVFVYGCKVRIHTTNNEKH